MRVMVVGGVVFGEDLAVVLLPRGGRPQDGVGFGDGDEAGGGLEIVGVAVWVVGFGQGIEGSWGSNIC